MSFETRQIAIRAMASGLAEATAPRATTALAWLDGERYGRAIPNFVRGFAVKAEAIKADKLLSGEGQRQAIGQAAQAALSNIAGIARDLTQLEIELARDRANAAPLPKADAADAVVDVALAALLREQKPTASALMLAGERVRIAAARLPEELTGLTPETKAQIHGSLISPELAQRLSEETGALALARQGVQSAIDELAPQSGLTPRELVGVLGANFRLPGVPGTVATRIAAGGAENVADGLPAA